MQLDYINGNGFANLAHYVFCPPEGKLIDNILKNNAIIFCKTDYLNLLFQQIRFSENKYILITHASDYSIDFNLFNQRPECIKKWFAENGEYDHPDLIPIPIGLENTKDENGCGKGNITKEKIQILSEKQDYFYNKNKNDNTIFCSFRVKFEFAHNTWVNPYRETLISDLEENNIKYCKPVEKLEQIDFWEKVSNYRFIMSPRGNGVDIHTAWEALYLGSIPIVLRNRIWNYNLPILQVDNWKQISNELLSSYLTKLKNRDFNNYEQLTLNYWKKRIQNEFNKF